MNYNTNGSINLDNAKKANPDVSRIQRNQQEYAKKTEREQMEATALSDGLKAILKALGHITPIESYVLTVETPELLKLLKSKAYKLWAFSFTLTDSKGYEVSSYKVTSVKWKRFGRRAIVRLERIKF